MTEGVKEQEAAAPEKAPSDKELNFQRLREERERDRIEKEREREARIRAEMKAEMANRELEQFKEMMKPKEADPFDSEDIDPDLKTRLQRKLANERQEIIKEAEKIAESVYEKRRDQELKSSVPQRLKYEFNDYDQIMNEQNIIELEQNHPAFTKAVLQIPDEYERKKLAYEYIKNTQTKKTKENLSIKEKVNENMQNPYYIPSSSGTPSAVEFDVKSPAAREAAYAALKAAQRRPLGRN